MQDTTSPHDLRNGSGKEHAVIDDPRHPIAGRIGDVLRNRSPKPKTILIDDCDNIAQAVQHNVRLDSLYITEGLQPDPISDAAGKHGQVPMYTLSRGVADDLFGGEKQARTFALAKAPRPAKLGDLSQTQGDVVVLDGVRLVGNIGAITRTSVGFGATGLVLLNSGLRNVFDRRLIRASRGLVFALPIVLTTPDEFVEYALTEQITVGTLAAHAPQCLESARRVTGRMAIVLGSERHGVSEKIDTVASHKYAIPMSPQVESLNVSVSAAIALYERSR